MSTKNVLVGILMVVIFAVGFMVGRFSSDTNMYMATPDREVETTSDGGSVSDETAVEGTTIEAASLSDGQKKLLGALGIDADSITVTPEMIACAEAALGPARIDEITNGATPSFGEGLKLAACY